MGLLPHRRLGLRFGVGLRPLLRQKLLQHLDLRFQLQRLLDDFHLLFVFHSVFSFSFDMDRIVHSVRLFRPTASTAEADVPYFPAPPGSLCEYGQEEIAWFLPASPKV